MTGEIENGAIYPSLKDRVVFITGGGSGIGESLVEHFCAQGARVTFVDMAEAPSRALVERIAAKGGSAPDFIPCDLRQHRGSARGDRGDGEEARAHPRAGQQCRQ